MPKKRKKSRSRPSCPPPVAGTPKWIQAARIGLILAMAIAAYLAIYSLAGGGVAGCGPGSPCEKVLGSMWAKVFDIPVTVPALAVYFCVLLALRGIRPDAVAATRERSIVGMVLGSVLILAAATWFVGVQVHIGAFCIFCCTAHLLGSVAAVLILANAGSLQIHRGESVVTVMPRQGMAKLAVLGVGVVAGFAWLQWTFPPEWNPADQAREHAVAVFSTNAVSETIPIPAPPLQEPVPSVAQPAVQPQTPDAEPVASIVVEPEPKSQETPVQDPGRILAIHNGQFLLNKDELPLLGWPGAKQSIVSLYDYTCHDCRKMHGFLTEALEVFKGQLSIISLPMPLDANCNPKVKQTSHHHVNACEYARICLAVYRASPEKYPEFDQWLFNSHEKKPLEAVRSQAVQILGQGTFQQALADPWVDGQIAMDVKIYEVNTKISSGRMPQLIIGRQVAPGPPARAEQLLDVLQKQLGLQRQPTNEGPLRP